MKTKSVTIWVMVVVLCLASSQAQALLFNDGLTHNIDWHIRSDVMVDYGAPSMQTTLNILSGGIIEQGLQAYGNSRINISGGQINFRFIADGNSKVNFTSGYITNLSASFCGQVTITGGNIIGGLYVDDSSQITLSGGLIYSGALNLAEAGVITIIGSDFAIDSQPFGYGELYSIYNWGYEYEPYRWLTGVLDSGDPIYVPFRIGESATIVLVPEPATLLLLGLGAVMVRKKVNKE